MSASIIRIIEKYYDKNSESFRILTTHSACVAKKALEIAKRVPEEDLDYNFIEEAALLHDIGVFLTDSPDIDCHGEAEYLLHGVLGREVLEKEGLPKHGLVCERHIGVGITKKQIVEEGLLLPERDMIPLSEEEEIIALADNFFGKGEDDLTRERSIEEVRERIKKHGSSKLDILNNWIKKYKLLEE